MEIVGARWAVVAVAALMLAGCGGATGGAAPTSPSAATAPPAEVLLVDRTAKTIKGDESAAEAAPEPTPAPTEVEQAVDQLEADVAADSGVTPPAEPTETFETVTSLDGSYRLTYPSRLNQFNWNDWTDGSERSGIVAFTSPGTWSSIRVMSTPKATTIDETLTLWRSSVAEYCPNLKEGPAQPYDDSRFRGVSLTVTGCGEAESIAVVAVRAADGKFTGYFTADIGIPADIPALGEAMRTFTVLK